MPQHASPAIVVQDVSKVYRIYDAPSDRFKEALNPFGACYHREFYALRDVSFELSRGERMALLGVNGAGKSTLLKIIAGIIAPTTGAAHVNGRLTSLLELGTGFDPDLPGLENIFFYGRINGIPKKRMQELLDDILSFADIGDFVSQPVKTYSSGMLMRLGFAVATALEPDILIVDEAISVGDMFFQAKCITRMRKMMDKGASLLFVSHDIGAVKALCTRALLLDKGVVRALGRVEDVANRYFALNTGASCEAPAEAAPSCAAPTGEAAEKALAEAMRGSQAFQARAAYERVQGGKARFLNVRLLDERETAINHVEYGQPVILRMVIEILEDIESQLGVGYHIRDRSGADVVYSDTLIEQRLLEKPARGEIYIIDWKFRLELRQGEYNIAAGAAIPIDIGAAQVEMCDFIPAGLQFRMAMRREAPLHGYVHISNEIQVRCIAASEQETAGE